MGIVQDAVADRVGEHRIGKVVVPLGRRQLARDDGRAIAVAVLEDLEEVPALLVRERRQAPIVDQQDVDAREFAEQANIGAIGAREGEVGPAGPRCRSAGRTRRRCVGARARSDRG
jgi:hypothetical protein